jgi:hypothetical protein
MPSASRPGDSDDQVTKPERRYPLGDGGAIEPPLVRFRPPEKPPSLMATVPCGAYDEPIYEMKCIGSSAVVVSDPAGVKRRLLNTSEALRAVAPGS